MVKEVTRYETEDGTVFTTLYDAVRHERRRMTEERLTRMLLEHGVRDYSSVDEIVAVLVLNRDEVQDALYYLDNG